MSRDSFGDNFSGGGASRGQLNSFLGMSSDEGMHSMSSSHVNANSFSGSGDFDVNRGAVEGPRGGVAAGASVTGPRGNTAYRGAAVGPNGGAVAGRGVSGADGGAAGRAVAVGPGGTVAAGGAVRGPAGNAAAGFARVSPSGEYACAAGVRSNYGAWGAYGSGWYGDHPGAWAATAWGAGAAWRAATWNSLGSWMNYYPSAPVEYDYGTNVTSDGGDVYVGDQDQGTTEQYYQQANDLATAGAQASAPADGNWLPLGVFALAKPDQTSSNITIQLAVDKQGIIRGNYTDSSTDKTSTIQGSVDKKTQRVAFTPGENSNEVIETGLYNLTKDEAPALVHMGKDQTEQMLLVRLTNQAPAGQTDQ